jgi:hypothetical protein
VRNIFVGEILRDHCDLGVEMGQLLFVAAVLSLAALIRISRAPLPRWAGLVPPYLIGSLAMFFGGRRVSWRTFRSADYRMSMSRRSISIL